MEQQPPIERETTGEQLSELLQIRRDKLAALQRAGQDPYQITTFAQTHHSDEIKAQFAALAGQRVSVAGRMMSKRIMGKASFAHVLDGRGDIQVYVKRDDVGEEAYAAFKTYDIGDLIGVSGTVFETRTGEISIHVEQLTLLSKSLRPLPEKFHGLKDMDLRYRQRFVDLIVNPEVRDTFRKRSRIIAEIRNRMDSLYRQFDRVVVVLEHTPQIADAALDDLNEQVTKILDSFNASVDHVFVDLGQQRTELQDFIDSQRVRLMSQTDSLAVHAVNTAMEALPSLLGQMLFYLTASLVVLFSIPFVLGYLLGRARERRKKNDPSENQP